MDGLGFILIVVLVFAFIAGPFLSLLITHHREKRRKARANTPEALRRARQKLGTVSYCPRSTQSDDIEMAASEPDECTICMGPLVPGPVGSTPEIASRRRSVAQILATIATRKPKRLATEPAATPDEEQAQPVGGLGHKPSTASATTEVSAASQQEPGENDIMILKSCSHSFHAKCLASWFVIERFDCPICRAPYYKTPAERRASTWRTVIQFGRTQDV